MRSTERALQSGQSLVEATVASALLGVAIVTGLAAVNAAGKAAAQATKEARASCVVRSELRAVLNAAWASSYAAPANVNVYAAPDPVLVNVQDVVVVAVDPANGATLRSERAYKAMRFSGTAPVDPTLVAGGCG